MTLEDINKIISNLVDECVRLKDKYVDEKDLVIDYVCIFSHNQDECHELIKLVRQIGKLADDTQTGPVYSFNNPPKTSAGKPKLIKIRRPDKSRPQKGDVDFNTNYENFKKRYLDNKKFTLIRRKGSEMIELRDNEFDVLVYFSNIPLSKQLDIS